MTILTPAVLSSLRATPLLAKDWYYIAAATFSVCNQPQEIPVIFRYAIEHDAAVVTTTASSSAPEPRPTTLGSPASDSLSPPGSPTSSHFGAEDDTMLADTCARDPADVRRIVRKTREALLKGAALVGLPRTINSLIQLRNATPHEFRDDDPLRRSVDREGSEEAELRRGQEFWNQVYGKVSRRVLSQMNTAYPDLAQYALQHVYAPLLSFTDVLSPKETSFVVVACLIPQDVNPQLKGHLHGGLNNGATKEELMSVRELAMKVSTLCGVSWKEEVAML
ncbi:AhpD-like protein [Limtongia smithiae]|uniref:AhpD-like protein n=1 Tax=Limtongia smithiae TaxID=1125753 RepID=UPI0034CE9508